MNPIRFWMWIAAGIIVTSVSLVVLAVNLEISPVAGILIISLPSIAVSILLFIPTRKRRTTGSGIIYHDRHIEIFDNRLVLYGLYIGPFGRKEIPLDQIQSVGILHLKYGNWKRQGTWDENVWFTMDTRRSNNMDNFVVETTGYTVRLAFSVDDFPKVSEIFRDKGLLSGD